MTKGKKQDTAKNQEKPTQKPAEESLEKPDLSPLENEPTTSQNCTSSKKCSWGCAFLWLIVLALFSGGAYFAAHYRASNAINDLAQKVIAAETRVNTLQNDIESITQKMGAKKKSENFVETLLSAVQNRIQNLENGEAVTSFSSKATTLLYFENDLDRDGHNLKKLIPLFDKHFAQGTQDIENIKTIVMRHHHISKKVLLNEARLIIAPPQKANEKAKNTQSFIQKIKDYFMNMVTIQETKSTLLTLDETAAFKKALDHGDIYAINAVLTPHALKDEAVERWLKVCDDYRELKALLRKLETAVIGEAA